MLSHIKKIIEDMGWTDGYHIPIANKQNIELEKEVERLTIAKAKATLSLDAVSSKVNALEKHFKNVQTEQEQNQTLMMARLSELKAEKEMYIKTKQEKERSVSDIKKYNKEYNTLEERKHAKLKELSSLVSKIDKLKASIEWDESSIEEWEEKLISKQEDNDIIKKFSLEDRQKAKDLEIKRQRLQMEFIARKNLVIDTSKETDNLQLILTRNVQLYKQLHEERSVLLKQWQEAVKNLQQRDRETLAVNRDIIGTKELIDVKNESLEQEKQFYQNELNNNAELEVINIQANAELSKLRKDLQNTHKQLQEYTAEVETIKSELKNSAHELETERAKIKNLYNEKQQKENMLKEILIKIQALRVQEKHVFESSLTTNERVKQLEELIENEEVVKSVILNEIENMQKLIYRTQKSLQELVNINKVKHVAIQGHEQGIIRLEKEKQKVDDQIVIQKDNCYKANFRLAMLLSKITRMEVGLDDDFSEENQRKLQELEVKYKESLDLSNLLQVQLDKEDELMRNLSNAITSDTDIFQKKKDMLQNLLVLVEGGKKQLENKKNANQQHQVEENVFQVRLKHAERQLQNEGDAIYNLQKQQIELESMVRERESEIRIQKDILIAKRNAIQEDNSRLRQDISGRKIKIDIMKKKVDGINESLGKAEDGATISVAYFKVKHAQEKYMLQEEGDKLDNMIQNAEKEIIAMENTLKAVNIANESVKKSLSIVEEPDDELQEIKNLENDIYLHTKQLRLNRNQFQLQQEELIKIQTTLNCKLQKIEELQNEIKEKQSEYDVLENEAFHRKTKVERTEKLIHKVSRKPINERQKRDFITRHLQDYNRSGYEKLFEMSDKYLETKPTITRYLEEQNLNLVVPSKRASTKSYSSLSYSSTSLSSVSIPSVSLQFQK